ncbi:MAG: uracil-xanthine permease family protein [Pirellulaceae bacterium]
MQARHGKPLRYTLDDWPPLSQTVLFGLQWAAIVIPSIIVLGHVVASLEFAEFTDRTPYLQKLFIVTAVTLVIQVLWGHRLPLIAGPATVLLIGVIASQGFPAGDIYTAILIGGVLLAVLALTGLFAQVRRVFTDRVIAAVLLLIAFTLAPTILKLLIAQDSGVQPLSNLIFGLLLLAGMFALHRWLPGIWKATLVVWTMLFGSVLYFLILPGTSHTSWQAQAWLSFGFLANLDFRPTVNPGVLISFLFCYLALAINALGSIQSMNRLLEVQDMDRRIFRGITVTGICNVLSGCLGVIGPVDYSLSPGVVMSTGCASRFTLIPAAVIVGIVGFSPAAITFLGGVPSVIVGCVMLYILTSQIAAGLLVANQDRGFQFEDGLVIGLPVLLGTVISFLPADVLTTFPVVLRPVLGNGFVIGTVGAFLLDRTIVRH